jgi:hypothetical protein
VKTALGVDPGRSFRSFNMDMNREFNKRGEGTASPITDASPNLT